MRGKGRGSAGGRNRKRQQPGGIGGLLAVVGLISLVGAWWSATSLSAASDFTCRRVTVADGDTFSCDGRRIRMVGIDAPEMPGHCRPGRRCTPGDPFASKANLQRLLRAGPVQCRTTDTDAFGRTVARCRAGTVDLSCRQVQGGFAVRRYGWIAC